MTDEATAAASVVTTLLAPLVARDGGTVRFVELVGDRATLALEGACVGCPARPITRDRFFVPVLSKALGRPIDVDLL